MKVRIKSYYSHAEAITDMAVLGGRGIEADLENTHDVHPTLVGQIFLVVDQEKAVEAIKLLNSSLFEEEGEH